MKFNIQTALIIFLLFISLALRIYRLEYPGILSSKWGDGFRDYLVAHYIRSYGEYPLLGPFNLLYDSGLRDSPLYYYLLALFLIPYDSVMILGLVNIIFQVITIALIYFLTKTIFDNKTAFLAVLLFSPTPEVLRQSEYIWQPTMMQSFVYLSLYFLTLSYFKKNYKLLLGSVVILNIAATLHKSAFAWFPLFLLLTFLIIRSQHKGRKYLTAFLSFFLSIILLHLPVFIYFFGNHKAGFGDYIKDSQSLYLNSVGNYFKNLFYNFSQILQVFSFGKLLMLFQTTAILGYLFLQRGKKRWFLMIAVLFFLEPIFISSLFNKNQLHYLTVSFGILAIIVSVTFSYLLDKFFSRLPTVSKIGFCVIVILLLLKVFSQDFKFLKPEKRSDGEGLINSAAYSINTEVQSIIAETKLSNNNFFQIISFAHQKTTFRYPTLDTIFLVPLEKKLNVKLAKISDDSPYNLVQTNDNRYIFLSCFEFDYPSAVKDCSGDFLTIYPNYTILKNIYNQYPLSIFLTKRNE